MDVEEEKAILHHLYAELKLANQKTAFHHLKLSEDHYLENRWDDSISNSRKFLECVLKEVVDKHNQITKGPSLSSKIKESPRLIREYLEENGLLEKKEKEALAKNYQLLSQTGSHPYMAEKDQARLLRHIALTFSQFVMLRLEGCIKV